MSGETEIRKTGSTISRGEVPARIYVDLGAYGIDQTPALQELKTIFPVLFNPFDRTMDTALLQGNIGATMGTDGVSLNWETLYAYYREQDDSMIPQQNASNWESHAFDMAYWVTRAVTQLIREAIKDGDISIKPGEETFDSKLWMEIKLEELAGIRNYIYTQLEGPLRFCRTKYLRERDGYYRWLALAEAGVQGAQVYTHLVIPDLLDNRANVNFYADSVPFQPGTDAPCTPRADGYRAAILSGIVHAGEEQPKYYHSCSMRAALLQYLFGDNFTPEMILAAAARVGIFPRLSSVVANGGLNEEAWIHLLAEGYAYEFFKNKYIQEAPMERPVGEVRYTFSGTGYSDLLQKPVMRYCSHQNVHIKEESDVISGKSGLFFFPATNAKGTTFQMAFVADARTKGQATLITPVKGPISYIIWNPVQFLVSRDGTVELSQEQQFAFEYHPMTFEPVNSVRKIVRYVGAGAIKTTTIIRDKKDQYTKTTNRMSTVHRALLLGFAPAYEPTTLMFSTRTEGNSRISDFEDVAFMFQGIATGAKINEK